MVLKEMTAYPPGGIPTLAEGTDASDSWIHVFERFHQSTQRLQKAYDALQEQVQTLNLELQEKNRELEKNLREKERLQSYLSHILEGLSVGVIVSDLQGTVTLANRAARQILGLPEEIWGQDVEKQLSGRLSSNQLRTLIEPNPERGAVVECRSKDPNGETLHLTLRSHPLLDPSGVQLGQLVTVEDLTELRSMEEEVARSQRLAAMGEMAASIVHEVRNPLGSIQLFTSLMAQEHSRDDREEMMNQIHAAIGTVDHILANLLTFARPYMPKLSLCDVGALMEECFDFLRPLAQQNGIQVELEVPENPPWANADRDLLKQALLNILLNAVQAMSQGGKLKAWIREQVVSHRGWKDEQSPMTSRWLEIAVKDTGEGIPGDVLPRVFDPFFTTRSEGTGLGLAIVHNILRGHGGGVNIESECGEGTCLRLRIPIRQDPQSIEGRELNGEFDDPHR